MPLDFNEIRQLLVTIAQTDIAEVTLKSNDFEIAVRKAVSFNERVLSVEQTSSGSEVNSGLTSVSSNTSALQSTVTTDSLNDRSQDNYATSSTQANTNSSVIDQRLVEVTSPMVGTFYRAPAPGEAAFVEIGDRVRSNQTVCIIEAMKLMNEIEAEISGQVMEILVQNGEPVEYGQPLMRINPD